MKRALAFSLLLATPSVALLPVSAQTPAAPGFQFLDDESEDAGFDVSAKVAKFGSELALNQAENGDGYVLRLSNGKADLLETIKGKTTTLASAPLPKVTLPAPLVAQRRGPRWRFTLGGQTLLEAEDATFLTGKIGTRGSISETRYQPVEAIAFDDDFMRVASDVAMRDALQNPRNGVRIRDAALTETIWTGLSGSWKTTGLTENAEALVAQSANPFAFRPMAQGENLSVAGHPFWSDYEASVSIQPQGAKELALLCDVQDAKNYVGLFWSDSSAPELRAVVDGKVRALARAAGMGGYEKDEWTKFQLVAASGTLRAFIDDAEVARAHTGLFGRGQIGLLARMDTAGDDQKGVGAVFDDVSVRSLNDFFDPFQAPVAGRWTTIGGNFAFGNGVAKPVGASGAFAVMGEVNWTNYVTSAQLSIPVGGAAGLILNHKSGDGAYMLRVGGSKSSVARGVVQLVENVKGKTQVLAQTSASPRFDGSNHVWTLSDERGYLSAKCDDELVVDAFNADRQAGRAGVWAQNGALARSFSVEWPQTRPTWAKVPAIFEVETQAETMGGWSTPRGFWIAQKQGDVSTLEHKGRFWGDETLRFPLPDLTGGKTATVSFGKVSVSLDSAGAKVSGGAKPASGKAELKTGAKVEISQRGNFVIVRADDAVIIAARV
ncbi:hypothetical protein IAD21_01024 [Abditibacteriota bacterium]|nr:hypothetical protein IAD21_01024 [Abditibacteriota bacterium]